MKKSIQRPGKAAANKTVVRLRQTALGLLLLTGLSLSGCRETNEPETPTPNTCSTFATVEDDACRDGLMAGKWLRLDNGELVLPQSSLVALPNLTHGQRVRLHFTTLQTNPDFVLLCNYVLPPESPARSIVITCLEPVGFCGTPPGNPSHCQLTATATNVMCGSGVWQSTWLKLDNGAYLQPYENVSGYANLVPGQRYRLGYEKMTRDNRYDGQVTCLAMPPAAEAVRLTCLQPETADSASVVK